MIDGEENKSVCEAGTNKHGGLKKLCAAMIVIAIIAALTISVTDYADALVKKGGEDPDLTAKSALVYCNTTDELVYEKNPHERLYPYSITKLMTAILTVENRKLSDVVTISKKASEHAGSSMELKEGEKVTVEQLLYGLLISSGNDAAEALAESSGNYQVFVDEMNKRAVKFGCTSTHFVNPSGFYDPNHYTTAEDFLKIANEAFKNDTIRKMAGTKKYRMPATNKQEARILKTHLDQLNKKNSGVVSGKTGFWEDNDCSIVIRYNKDNLELTVVILGETKEERIKDANKLFRYADKYVQHVKILKKGQIAKKAWIRGGEKTLVTTYVKNDSKAYPKDGKASSTRTEFELDKGLHAPLKKGAKVGKCRVYSDGRKIDTVALILKENVNKGWLPSQIYISNRASIIGISAVLLIILISIIIRVLKNRSVKEEYMGRHSKK